MKKFHVLKSSLLLLGCCLFLSACGKKTEDLQEGDPPTPTGKAGFSQTIGTGGQAGEVPTPTGKAGFSQAIGAGGQIGEALPLTGKALGELPVAGKEDAVYCNLPENVHDWDDVVPLCPDPLYGILYYVDYGGDYMIHAIYNGEGQTVLELPGRRLFCRGGKLYFLLESYNRFKFEGAQSGNIAEYDPVTGEVKILSDKIFSSIVVYQDMICCRYKKGTKNIGDGIMVDDTDSWFYFFDRDEFVEAGEPTEYALGFRRYGEYFVAATLQESEEDPRFNVQVGMELRRWDGERGTGLEGLASVVLDDYYVKDGKFHWLDGEGFHIWEPVSGEEQIHPWEGGASWRYVLVGDMFFSARFRLMDLGKGSQADCKAMGGSISQIHEVYTDGSQIYVIAGGDGSKVNKNSALRRVVLAQVGNQYEASFEVLYEEAEED